MPGGVFAAGRPGLPGRGMWSGVLARPKPASSRAKRYVAELGEVGAGKSPGLRTFCEIFEVLVCCWGVELARHHLVDVKGVFDGLEEVREILIGFG